MEQLPENDFEQIDATTDVIKPSTGYLLRTARESQGMSIEDVVAKIKLAPRQIIALEADDFKALPELPFIRGFVRSYAKMLQLDVQPLLDGLPGAVKEKVEPVQLEVSFSTEKKLRQQNVNLLLAALIVALLIGVFAIWQARVERPKTSVEAVVATPQAGVPGMVAAASSEMPAVTELVNAPAAALPVAQPVAVPVTQPVAVPVTQPVAVPVTQPVAASVAVPVTQPVAVAIEPVSAVSASSEKTVLRLVFDKESWAEIKDRSGKTLSRQVNQPGSELRLDGTAPFTLVIGHAAAVHLFYREKPVDLTSYINASSDVARMTLK